MRLWSQHPRHLDVSGLVALCREALLAQAVLRGETQGYRRHPYFVRFRAPPLPASSIAGTPEGDARGVVDWERAAYLVRKPQHPFGDDVELNLRASGGDRVRLDA